MSLLDIFNRKAEINENEEGVVDEPATLLSFPKKEEELIELKNKWLEHWKQSEVRTKTEEKQKINERYWLGNHWTNAQLKTGKRPLVDNLVFESLEEALPVYTRQIAEPNITADERNPEAQALAKKVSDKIYDIADVLRLRLKIKKAVRYWALYYLGVIKIGWSNVQNEMVVQPIRPQDLVLDPDAITDECEYQGDYLGHYRTDTADNLIAKFPNKAKEIKEESKEKLGTKIKYLEWWTNDFVFWTLKDTVLAKAKNPHWNYDIEGTIGYDESGNPMGGTVRGNNHFSSSKIPFAFLSVFSIGKGPYDDTNLVDQVIPLQDKVNKRLRQIDRNADRTNGGIVVSGDFFSKEQASEAATALERGDAIRVPTGNVGNAYKRDIAPALPQFIYTDLVDSRNELRGVFGATGLSAQGIKSEETVRGKILVKSQDSDRAALIVDHIEQFYDYIFNWFFQMMMVYYEEGRPVSAAQGETISASEFIYPLIISVKEGSLIPKDRLTQRNEAIDLWGAGGLDPISFYEKLEFPDPYQSAKNLFLWRNNPLALFPDLQQQMLPPAGGFGTEGGVLPAGQEQEQGRESLLSNVPIA